MIHPTDRRQRRLLREKKELQRAKAAHTRRQLREHIKLQETENDLKHALKEADQDVLGLYSGSVGATISSVGSSE